MTVAVEADEDEVDGYRHVHGSDDVQAEVSREAAGAEVEQALVLGARSRGAGGGSPAAGGGGLLAAPSPPSPSSSSTSSKTPFTLAAPAALLATPPPVGD